MKNLVLVAAAVLLPMAGATAAQAAKITYTYTGTVSSGSDGVGVFGTIGADLTGLAFKVVDVFDTAKQAFDQASGDGATYSEAQGGTKFNAPFFASAAVTIGGKTTYISPTSLFSPVTFAQVYSLPNATYGQADFTLVQSLLDFGPAYKNEYVDFNAYSSLLSYDYTKPGVFDLTNTMFAGSYSDTVGAGPLQLQTVANLAVSRLVISAVPLPASAPLFGAALLSLGLVGYGLKRRRVAASI